MRVTVLEVSAQLENVTELTLPPSFEFSIKFQCNNCGTESENFMTFTQDDQVPMVASGKSTCNLQFKCKMCSRHSSVSVVEGSIKSYLADHSPQFKPIVELDCRGCSPVEFQPVSHFTCRSVNSDHRFTEVDLSELNWADYDEKAGESVGVYEFQSRFDSLKK